MPPNWLIQWSPIIENLATAVAVIGGAFIAGMGLNAWKKQLRGQTDYDLARKLMKAVYKVRNEIELARDPFIMSYETDAAVEAAGFNEFEKKDQIKQAAAVYAMRYQKVATCWIELETQILEGEATWGSEWTGVKDDLEMCVKELRAAFHSHNALKQDRRGYSPDKINEIDRIVYSYKDKTSDKFAQKVDDAVEKFEDISRPHLGRKVTKKTCNPA
jgi:hypothetical protein